MTTADDLRAISSSAADELEQLTAALADLGAALQQKSADLDAALAQVASLQLEVARLTAELEDCNPSPPATVFGAYAQPQGRKELDEFGARVGPVGVTRLFYGSTSSLQKDANGKVVLPVPGVPTIASLHSRSFTETTRPKHLAVASGAIDGRVATFAGKVKAYLDANPGEVFVMSFVAEPDVAGNLDLGSSPTHAVVGPEHVQAYLRVRSVFDAVIEVPWAMILTGTTFNTNSSSRNPGMFWHDSYDMVGIDPYNMGDSQPGPWKMLDAEIGKAVAFAQGKGGKPLIVPEFGCVPHETDPNARAAWLTATAELFRASGITLAVYFHADKRFETPEGNRDFRFYVPSGGAVLDQPALEAYQAILQG